VIDQQVPALADLRDWHQQTVVNRKRGDLIDLDQVDHGPDDRLTLPKHQITPVDLDLPPVAHDRILGDHRLSDCLDRICLGQAPARLLPDLSGIRRALICLTLQPLKVPQTRLQQNCMAVSCTKASTDAAGRLR
jgi:hypothetical protein